MEWTNCRGPVVAAILIVFPFGLAHGQAPGAIDAAPPAAVQGTLRAEPAHPVHRRVESHIAVSAGLAATTFKSSSYQLQGHGTALSLSYTRAWFRALPKWRFGVEAGLAGYSKPTRVDGSSEMTLGGTVIYQPGLALTAERVVGGSWTVRGSVGATMIVYGTDGARAISRPGGLVALRGQKLWKAGRHSRIGVALDLTTASFEYGDEPWNSAGLVLNFVGGFAL